MRSLPAVLLLLAASSACDGGNPADPDAAVAVIDGAAAIDGAPGPDAEVPECGVAEVPVAMITDTEGIAIADNGTVYYSQTGQVGRWVPGTETPVDDWVELPGTSTVWGMALDDAGVLYVATPGTGGDIWQIDTTAATPVAEVLYPNAGSANGLTVGPDGAVYYSDFSGAGHVYRVDSSGDRTTVTATTIDAPNGVLFDADGTLLVLSYDEGNVRRLTLDADQVEIARDTIEIAAGNPDGLARDVAGRYYVTNNSGGVILRYDASFENVEPIGQASPSAANMAFGRGALPCENLYVTSSAALQRIDVGATGVP